ncbi:HET-domain-containing protein [Sordaria brevicollis]|uniref:HET-domain-containing protein n=1 Tax=Sordaria brevicollis TaxID=83679 RepID=A0AAE0PBR2_SORBR|nr:HET-domain-containing protein [Sordaria brevicollis]
MTYCRSSKVMDISSETPSPDIGEIKCRGLIAGGDWPGEPLSAESLSPWWKPSDSGNPLEVITDSLPQSLCRACALIRDTDPKDLKIHTNARRTIHELEPGVCGICRILFVAYKIMFRNFPTSSLAGLGALLTNRSYLSKGGNPLFLESADCRIPGSNCPDYRSRTSTCPDILISCNVNGTEDVPCPWGLTESFASTHAHLLGGKNQSSGQQTLKSTSSAWISRGLEECARQDEKCCGISKKAPPPTRLLDVGLSSGVVRLVETSHLHTPIHKYNCLSHCWGTQQPLQTTRENYSRHLTSIAWDIIPRTFQDAIRLTLDLGIEFLWIDSLCIIQHDEEDWERESANMCSVYANSYLTIAATSSPDCHGGLKYWENRELFKITGFTADRAPISISLVTAAYQIYYEEYMPLMYRAWFLQERIMSPRVVHFLSPGLVLECNGRVIEQYVKRVMWDFYPAKSKRQYHNSIVSDPLELKGEMWRHLVAGYSQSDLSFPSDKLPAISGLAHHMAKHRAGAYYLAGLWSDTLAEDLLWIRRCPAQRPIWKAQPQRAPSWSWASWDGELAFLVKYHMSRDCLDCQLPQTTPLLTLLDVENAPSTAKCAGDLSTMPLCVSGKLSNAPSSFVFDESKSRFEIGRNNWRQHYSDHVEVYLDEEALSGNALNDYLSSQEIKSFRVLRGSEHGGSYQFECALLLRRVGSSSTDYVRVGVASETRIVYSNATKPGTQASHRNTWVFRSTWEHGPSIFEAGAVEATIRIL